MGRPQLSRGQCLTKSDSPPMYPRGSCAHSSAATGRPPFYLLRLPCGLMATLHSQWEQRCRGRQLPRVELRGGEPHFSNACLLGYGRRPRSAQTHPMVFRRDLREHPEALPSKNRNQAWPRKHCKLKFWDSYHHIICFGPYSMLIAIMQANYM